MATVNFYLNKNKDEVKRSLVYLQMYYQGVKFVYSMRFNIDPENWNLDKQEVRERSATTKDGSVNLNKLLKTIKEEAVRAVNVGMASGNLSNEYLRNHLDKFMPKVTGKKVADEGTPTLYKLIQDFIDRRVGDRKSEKQRKSESTITTYKTSLKHLKEFEKAEKYPVDFHTINLVFREKYVNYLERDKKVLVTKKGGKPKPVMVKGMSANSVVKEIKNIRTFMNKAVDLEYTTNLAFKKSAFSVESEETDAVYLTEKEIRNLYKFDFRDNKRLEAVRDLFVFSCFVGLRISDASRITSENVVKIEGANYIKITSKKTKVKVTIPCNDVVLSILEKYKGTSTGMPPAISDQKYNQYLKELAEIAGMDEKGRLASDLSLPLYKCIASHTARRSFATNCYLDGMDNQMIMAVTGHKTEKSFLTYIKVTREENAKRMMAHMKKSLSKKSLKIA